MQLRNAKASLLFVVGMIATPNAAQSEFYPRHDIQVSSPSFDADQTPPISFDEFLLGVITPLLTLKLQRR
jgi:hypothetical protein